MGTNFQPKRVLTDIQSYPLGLSPKEMKTKYQLNRIIKMNDNENVYGYSEAVEEAIKHHLKDLHLYPDGNQSILIKKIAEFYQLDENQVLVGNGSDEIIRLLTRAYINSRDEAIMADITFPRYETNVRIEGGIPIKVPLIDGTHDLRTMFRRITDQTKIIFICNPNNPTGTIVDKEELYHFIVTIPSNILIVLDEAYYEYVSSLDYLQSIPLLKQFSNLIILRTFSKIYGLAGLRIGYGLMHPSIIKEVKKVKEVFNVNHLAIAASVQALEDQEFVSDCASKNAMEREFLCKQLLHLGVSFFPSQGNFLYVYSQNTLTEKLLERGFLVRPMRLDGYKDAFRMSFGTRENHEQLLEIIKSIMTDKAV